MILELVRKSAAFCISSVIQIKNKFNKFLFQLSIGKLTYIISNYAFSCVNLISDIISN